MRKKGWPATKADARRGWKTAARLFAALGLKVHHDKGEREGTTSLQLLGHFVGMRLGVFRLQPKLMMKFETMAAALLRYESKHQRWVRLGTLR